MSWLFYYVATEQIIEVDDLSWTIHKFVFMLIFVAIFNVMSFIDIFFVLKGHQVQFIHL